MSKKRIILRIILIVILILMIISTIIIYSKYKSDSSPKVGQYSKIQQQSV